MIERHLEGGKIDLAQSKPIGYGPEDRQLAMARLQFLEGIGLAQKEAGRGGRWTNGLAGRCVIWVLATT